MMKMAPVQTGSENWAHSLMNWLNTANISVVSTYATFLFLCSNLSPCQRHLVYIQSAEA